MVSRHSLSLSIAALFLVLPALAQSVDLVPDESRQPAQTPGIQPTTPLPPRDLTPERRGDIYMARKMYREAVEMYKQAPQSAAIWNKLGIAYHQMVQLNTAQKHYEKAIKLNPKYSEAINNLGTVHYARKSYRKAIKFYQRALRLSPESASIYSNLGTAYFARKKYKQAFEAYQKALALDPEVFEHRSTFGTVLQERSVEERAKFHYYLARTYAKAGDFEHAITYLRKAFEEGFKDRQKVMEEAEFEKLRETAEFQQLMKLEPKVL